ncbi:hypothetical protein ACLOJK_006448, partial [Asimina triloba]
MPQRARPCAPSLFPLSNPFLVLPPPLSCRLALSLPSPPLSPPSLPSSTLSLLTFAVSPPSLPVDWLSPFPLYLFRLHHCLPSDRCPTVGDPFIATKSAKPAIYLLAPFPFGHHLFPDRIFLSY